MKRIVWWELHYCSQSMYFVVPRYFGLLSKYWAHLDYDKKNVLMQTHIGHKMVVATLLMNVWTCLEGGNQISYKFACAPPSLEKYLAD